MVKATVLYGRPDDPEAFNDYYANTHTPLAQEIPDMERFEVAHVVGTGDGSEAQYHLVAELWFKDMQTFEASMGSEAGQNAVNDVPNFATGGATILVSEVMG